MSSTRAAELLRMKHGGCHPGDGCQDGDGFDGAEFDFLAANVKWQDTGDTLFPPYKVVENVTAVRTTRRKERTAKEIGIGFGSTRAQVKKRVTGVVCSTRRLCTKGRLEPGRRVTVFRLFRPRRERARRLRDRLATGTLPGSEPPSLVVFLA